MKEIDVVTKYVCAVARVGHFALLLLQCGFRITMPGVAQRFLAEHAPDDSRAMRADHARVVQETGQLRAFRGEVEAVVVMRISNRRRGWTFYEYLVPLEGLRHAHTADREAAGTATA